MAKILKDEMKIAMLKILERFPTTSEMFPLKMMK